MSSTRVQNRDEQRKHFRVFLKAFSSETPQSMNVKNRLKQGGIIPRRATKYTNAAASGYKFCLSCLLFRSVSDVQTLRSIREKKDFKYARKCSAVYRNN